MTQAKAKPAKVTGLGGPVRKVRTLRSKRSWDQVHVKVIVGEDERIGIAIRHEDPRSPMTYYAWFDKPQFDLFLSALHDAQELHFDVLSRAWRLTDDPAP